MVKFDQINGKVSDFSNLKKRQPVTAKASARFMDDSMINAECTMPVYSADDDFQVRADIHDYDLASINAFTEPVLDIKISGNVKDYYFTLDGKKEIGYITTRISYDDLKIELVNKKGQPKWLLSGIANLLVKKSRKEAVKEAQLTRDASKTVFNFIWKIQKKALREVVM